MRAQPQRSPGRRRRRISPPSSTESLSEFSQANVDALPGELDLVQRCGKHEHRSPRYAEREELRAGHVRPALVERNGMDESFRQTDRKDAHGNEHDAEQRIDSTQIGAARSG